MKMLCRANQLVFAVNDECLAVRRSPQGIPHCVRIEWNSVNTKKLEQERRCRWGKVICRCMYWSPWRHAGADVYCGIQHVRAFVKAKRRTWPLFTTRTPQLKHIQLRTYSDVCEIRRNCYVRLKHRGVCVMQKLFTELYITSEDAICSNGSADTSDNSKGAYDMQEVVCWELCESNDLINDRERL